MPHFTASVIAGGNIGCYTMMMMLTIVSKTELCHYRMFQCLLLLLRYFNCFKIVIFQTTQRHSEFSSKEADLQLIIHLWRSLIAKRPILIPGYTSGETLQLRIRWHTDIVTLGKQRDMLWLFTDKWWSWKRELLLRTALSLYFSFYGELTTGDGQ